LAAALLAALFVMGACGSDDPETEGVAGSDIEELAAEILPQQVLGLDISKEDISDSLDDAEGSYVTEAALYAFRSEELLQATLQVSRFSDEADPKSSRFRNALVNQIGGTTAQQVRVGDTDVYLTRGNRQRIAVWFDDDVFYVLSTREDFDRPRGLLREVVELGP
jgi:hypothetical protein